jgi:two-component system capsular synthesis sensor histidine kinase RcsC
VIRKQTRQLTQLVEQILLFAATQNGGQQFAVKVIDPREVIDQALANTEELTQASGFEVERHIDEDVPPIRGDVMALSQCVQNLITNAIKYIGESRWIVVRASAGEHNGHKEVLICVEDRGMGIAKSELHRIFDPFYRSPAATAAQIHGTGIGLSLAKKIADAMCGHITVLSEPGKGSSFVLHLPAATREELHAAEAEPAAVAAQGSEQA